MRQRQQVMGNGEPQCLATVFGGTEPTELAAAIGSGFATWIDTDGRDDRIVETQGAMVVRAPLQTVYETVTDFESLHRFIGVARRTKKIKRTDRTIEMQLRQGVGLGPVSLGLAERFRFHLHPPHAVCCEAYLDGPFDEARLEWRLFEAGEDLTLIVMTFLADVTQLGGLVRLFFAKQPELGFTVSGHVVIVPLLSYAKEAERRHRTRSPRVPSRPLTETLDEGLLAPALKHGYLTVGRVDAEGKLIDISCATRLGVEPDAVWPALEDPRVLGDFISFISAAELRRVEPDEIQQRLEYKIRFGPLKKRYTYKRRARVEASVWTRTISAEIDGYPVLQDETLWPEGPNTKVCQVYYFDLKTDWLSNIFLRRHAEFEHLIATYSPSVFIRALRRMLGQPKI